MNNNHCTPVCFPLPLAILLVTIPPPRPLIGREWHACQCYTCDAQWAELTPVIMLGMQLQTIRYLCDVLLVLLCNCSCCCSMRKWGPTPGHQPPLYPKPTFLHITQNDLSQGVKKMLSLNHFLHANSTLSQGSLKSYWEKFTFHLRFYHGINCIQLAHTPDPALVTPVTARCRLCSDSIKNEIVQFRVGW